MSEILRGAIDQLVAQHGGLRAAARVLQCDPSYLSRRRAGGKDNPGAALLKKLGLRRVVTVTFLPLRKSNTEAKPTREAGSA